MILNIPNRSEGYLCITPSYNNPIETIVDNILQGNVKLVMSLCYIVHLTFIS